MNILIFLPIANILNAYQIAHPSGKIIVIILLIGSIIAWTIMLTKYLELKAGLQQSDKMLAIYNSAKNPFFLYSQNYNFNATPLFKLYHSIMQEVAKSLNIEPNQLDIYVNSVELRKSTFMDETEIGFLNNLAEQYMASAALDLEKYMRFLATAATSAPFLGLLGTVWGVMEAFGGLALTSSATLSAVAPGVSAALLTTVIGLVVALPSSIGYNILLERIRKINILMEQFHYQLLADIERFVKKN
jgi:biopolymer transport protein TolQ